MNAPDKPAEGPGDPAPTSGEQGSGEQGSGLQGSGEQGSGEQGSGVPGSGEQESSGLRNPPAAVRGVGAGALSIEALVLLLAIVPMIRLGGRLTGVAVGVVVAMSVCCLVLTGMLRRRWAWYAGAGVQVVLMAGGVLHGALAFLGVLFGAVWAYVLSVRHSVLGRGRAH